MPFWTSVAFAATMVPPGVLSPTDGPPPPGDSPVPLDALAEGLGLLHEEAEALTPPPDPCCVTHRAAASSSADNSTMT
ncbi:hypothetical protein SAM40697_5200 [Streptomyces ambofaciens]|uniref:Secreted protein n=1 Tax=Streptomyces ambofaciens TaxID=1889 RepID=A0ABM6B622_STRAM|nr:hypothetical protein SAM40697_5200 [Streptomyces ambofaciens]